MMYMTAGFTGENGDKSRHCVGTATSSTPEGPYTPSDSPFACEFLYVTFVYAQFFFQSSSICLLKANIFLLAQKRRGYRPRRVS